MSGCGSLVERDTDGVVLFDIGGGSSEIALVDVRGQRSPRLANHIVAWTSLPVGVVSLAERFGGRDVTPQIFEAMVERSRRTCSAASTGATALAPLTSGARFHLLGTSGTVTTLAGVHLELERYDRRRVDGLWMDRPNVDAMIEKLLGWDFDARVANPCIGADRADLVLAGCAILEAIRGDWPSRAAARRRPRPARRHPERADGRRRRVARATGGRKDGNDQETDKHRSGRRARPQERRSRRSAG